MKASVHTLALAAALALSSSAVWANDSLASVNVPSSELRFGPTGIGPLLAAPGYRSAVGEAHGTFTKLPAGFASPNHSHSHGYYGVVITGVIVNGPPGAREVPLPAGSYWYQRGGENHITKCVSANECLTFISQTGKFDFIPAKP